MARWNPWRELRRRPHLLLHWRYLRPSRGRIYDTGGLRMIELDPRLSRVERNAVLAHELVHDEFDLIWPAGTPPALIEKGENFVEAVTAERLVPDDELREFVEKVSEFEGVTSRLVAEEFEVPVDVAHRALLRLVAGF